MSAALIFGGGIVAEMSCAMKPEKFGARLTLGGSKGRLEIDNFLAPQRGCRFTTILDGITSEHPTEGPTTYEAQLDHVVDVMTKGASPLTGGADAVANMAVIDAIYAAAGRKPA
jgi:predicted dehydrogenase